MEIISAVAGGICIGAMLSASDNGQTGYVLFYAVLASIYIFSAIILR